MRMQENQMLNICFPVGHNFKLNFAFEQALRFQTISHLKNADTCIVMLVGFVSGLRSGL